MSSDTPSSDTPSHKSKITAQRRFAAFDIDGTLIRWQLYHTMVDKLAKSGFLGERAHKELHESRMVWKNRENSDSFRHYEIKLINIFESSLPNIPAQKFDQLVHEIIDEYKDQVYTYTRDLIVSLKKKGYFLLAISGSHQELIEKLAGHYNFDDWIGAQYARNGNKFSGEKSLPGLNKQKALHDMIVKHNLDLKDSVAVGDTKTDVSMLKMVERPIAFNPEQTLYKYAQQNGWPVVIERKNVIYKLEMKHGHYVLV